MLGVNLGKLFSIKKKCQGMMAELHVPLRTTLSLKTLELF